MHDYHSSISPKGQITLPQELRERWGLKAKDRITIRIEDDLVTLMPVRSAIDATFGAVPPLAAPLSDAEVMAIAAEDHAAEIARERLAGQA